MINNPLMVLHTSTRRQRRLIIVAIFVAALAVRLWGIGFGLPYEYHVDEVQYVRQAASMGVEGLKPVWWNNPPFYKYVYLVEYGGLYLLGKVLGWYGSVADFGTQSSLDPTRLYLVSRATTALIGAATTLILYKLTAKAYGERTGWIAMWFLAVCFLHARDSHYAVNDIPLTFFTTTATLASIGIAQSGERKWYLVGGLALGLGIATKYSAMFAIVPLTVAHLYSPHFNMKTQRFGLRQVGLGISVAAMSAIIASPYFIITPAQVFKDAYEALYIAGKQGFDGWQIDPAGGYIFYLKTLYWGIGIPLLALGIIGVGLALLRHEPVDVIMVSLPLVLYLLMGRQKMYFARFILPAIPPLMALAASVVQRTIASFNRSKYERIVLAGTILLVSTAQPCLNILRHDWLLTQPDTRTVAKTWIEANVPDGARIAMDWRFHGPPLATSATAIPGAVRSYEIEIAGGVGLSTRDLAAYQEDGTDYLIVSSFIYDVPLLSQQRDDQRRAFYASLDRELRLAQVFKPGNNMRFVFDELYGPTQDLWQRTRPGPVIKVYSVQ